jgi:hypothetical protein
VTAQGTLDEEGMRRRGRELRTLLNGWDPIGVTGEGGPTDEYDCLLSPLMRLLEGGASVREISRYLEQEFTDHFGLSAAPQRAFEFAERAKSWFEGSWAGTRVPGGSYDETR